MKSPEELKKELAALESQQQPETPAQTDDATSLKGIFDEILRQSDEQNRQWQEAEDRAMKVCSNCYRLQDKEDAVCELCDASPDWLVPSKVRRNDEQDKFRSMAENDTIGSLRNALRSTWCCNSERQRVTRLLLSLREAQAATKQVEQVVEESVVENIRPINLDMVNQYLDMKIAEAQRQIDAAKGQA